MIAESRDVPYSDHSIVGHLLIKISPRPSEQTGIFGRKRNAGKVAMTAGTTDAELLELGREFEKITAVIDRDIAAPDREITEPQLDRLGLIESAILATPATTVEGFRVKARAAAWALLGDINPTTGKTLDERMALSIVHDLIRLYDPELERPGALAALIRHNEDEPSKNDKRINE